MNYDDKLDPAAATQLMYRFKHTSYRNTDIEDKSSTSPDYGVRFSDWISLTEGEYYYVEATLYQGSGGINLDVGMEVKPSTMPAEHPKLERMVQKMSLG